MGQSILPFNFAYRNKCIGSNLDEWGEGWGGVYILKADSHCYTAETDTTF